METPASISGDDQAAMAIQQAYRKFQKRIVKDHEDLATMLNVLEEAEENRINSREKMMARINKEFSRGLGRTMSFKNVPPPTELPSLSEDSVVRMVDSVANGAKFAMTDALAILHAAQVLFADEPTVVDVKVPDGGKVIVVGDLHGQLEDLLLILANHGRPTAKIVYIFNGDLVDRGDRACEIVLLILAFKIACPESVYVNRGNHEEPHINIYSGFEEEVIDKYDHRVFQMFHGVFVWLPFACVVNGKALVLHGGLPQDQTVTLAEIRELARGPDVVAEESNFGKEDWIKDILWSDPHPEPDFNGAVHSKRGAGCLFGEDVSTAFLDRENLSVMIRSHQCVMDGFDIKHNNRVYTVFSASNYCGTSGNMGAVLIFESANDDRPSSNHSWPPIFNPGEGPKAIRSKRASKEMRRRAAVQQASEYILEHRPELLEFWRGIDTEKRGAVSVADWAHGLASVLQVRMAWHKLVSGLVAPEEMDDRGDVRYAEFLSRFSVELKGGCRAWQNEVLNAISAAVMQSGGDLAAAFKVFDRDSSGSIDTDEFRDAVRLKLPSLAVLSDAQLDAVCASFDADGSGQVDLEEFTALIQQTLSVKGGSGSGGEGDADGGGVGSPLAQRTKKVGLVWDGNWRRTASGKLSKEKEVEKAAENDIEASDGGDSGASRRPGAAPWERPLADAIAALFYTHRQELFHIWHTCFDVDRTGSIAAEQFISSVRALDKEGPSLLSEEALSRLAELLDTNGDGRIDYQEFSRNISALVGLNR